MFALEIPYKNDLDRETFIEAVVASVPAYLLSVAVLGSEPLFGSALNMPITWTVIALSLLLGLICGLYSVFFTKIFSCTEQAAFKLRKKIGSVGLICLAAVFLSVSGFVPLGTIGVGFGFAATALIQGIRLSCIVFKSDRSAEQFSRLLLP